MIKIAAIPSTLCRKGSVKNVEDCNYEFYLTEIVNASDKFKQIAENKEIIYCRSQSNGEWDCEVEGKPFLDFKFLCSQKMLQDIGETDWRLKANDHGTYDLERPVIKNTDHFGYWTHLLLSNLTVDDLQKIYAGTGQYDDPKAYKDLLRVLKVTATDKDCLFLYSEFFISDIEISFEEMTEGAITFLNRWVPTLFKFRDSNVPNKKTYFSFMIPKFKMFVICSWNGEELVLFDTVPFEKSKNLMKYCRITPFNTFTKELFWG